tara:strand:+ start:149 stop:580 length:432 start_codon:yes stop_codon:yes gene_type:complete
MEFFSLSPYKIDPFSLRESLKDSKTGAFASFEGIVRNHNLGSSVEKLEYEVYPQLAVKEGLMILEEVKAKFEIIEARAVHRYGQLKIGDLAVWVGVIAAHRGPAFEACEYTINTIKKRVPIWKKEYYTTGNSNWIQCHEKPNL